MHGGTRHPTLPASAVLLALADRALAERVPAGTVTLGWLFSKLRERSFGLAVLVCALVGLLPGVSTLAALLLVVLAAQMMAARPAPALPRFVARRGIALPRMQRLILRAVPRLRRLERILRPRWRLKAAAAQRAVGAVLFALGVLMLAPIPFAQVAPGLAAALIALAYLEEDGAMLALGLAAALGATAFAAVTVWAAWQGLAGSGWL